MVAAPQSVTSLRAVQPGDTPETKPEQGALWKDDVAKLVDEILDLKAQVAVLRDKRQGKEWEIQALLTENKQETVTVDTSDGPREAFLSESLKIKKAKGKKRS